MRTHSTTGADTSAHRIEPLDWLRGLLAVSIMAYHLTWWALGKQSMPAFLDRLGAYGVSMFFILSGLSIAHVYHRFIASPQGSRRFLVRRVFRIWPLLWLAIGVTAATRFLAGDPLSWKLLLLNLTTLFAFVMPTAYINTGAWSIGNEMVYYAVTPLLLLLYNRSRRAGNAATVASVAIGLLFSHHLLNANLTLASQWGTYVNPFNNLFLYCIGVAIFYNADRLRLSTMGSMGVLLAAIAVFAFYPVEGDQIAIVTGTPRIAFSAASVATVIAFYKAPLALPPWLTKPLTELGLMTYGVYLLHPVVWQTLWPGQMIAGHTLSPTSAIALTVVLTLGAAWASYHWYELPLIRVGKKFTPPPHNALANAAADGSLGAHRQ